MGPSKTSELEREVMRECINEAFWHRSLPASLATGTLVHQLIKAGKIKTSMMRGLPIILGSSSLAYVIGKFSYILGDKCASKFLEKVPDSVISIRYLEKIQSEQKLFQPIEIKISWGDSSEETVGGSLADLQDRILPHLEHLTEAEDAIIDDCNSAAFWQYSLPLSLVCSSLLYTMMKWEILPGSRINKTFPRAPKTLMGGALGYVAGQWLYLYSRDCPQRFLNFAPEGEIARRLRGERGQTGKLVEEQINMADYIIPGEEPGERDKLLRQQQTF